MEPLKLDSCFSSQIDIESVVNRLLKHQISKIRTFSTRVRNIRASDACDAAIIIRHELRQILSKRSNINLLTDSKTLFNIININASTTERRLMIDVKAAREVYRDGVINDVVWIKRTYNLADSTGKATILRQLV